LIAEIRKARAGLIVFSSASLNNQEIYIVSRLFPAFLPLFSHFKAGEIGE